MAKDYKLLIRIAGAVDASLGASLSGATTKLKASLGRIDSEFTRLDAGFDKIMGVGAKAFQAIATAATAAGAAISVAGSKVIEAGSNFEAQMSTVEAITQGSYAEMERLEEKAKELGETTKYSATEVAQAMEYMGMAGWKSEQMIAGIDGVVSLAAASGEDLALVSDMVTDNLTAFGMAADEAGRFVDVMAAAATNANTNVAMMQDTFKFAAPVAGALGYSVEDVAIATGIMANSGIKASIAGTTLRNMFSRMAAPTKDIQIAMDKLGLSLTDSEGNMLSFMQVMERMRDAFRGAGDDTAALEEALTALGGLDDSQVEEELANISDGLSEIERAAESATIAGQRGMAGMLAIVNASDEDFRKLSDAINNSAGAAERMAEVRIDNLAGDAKIFESAMEGLEIKIYDKIQPGLRGIVQYGTRALGEAKGWLPEIVESAVSAVEESLPRIEKAFKKYALPVLEGFEKAGRWAADHGDDIIGVIAGIGGALATYKILSTTSHIVTMLMSLNPVSATILGIVSAAGVLVGLLAKIRAGHERIVRQSVADHFGEITLSLEELDEIAGQIVGSGRLSRLSNMMGEFDKLEGIADEIRGVSAELDKADWKVSVGLRLSDAEAQTYRSQISRLVEQTRGYIDQAYSADLSALMEGMTAASLTANGSVERLDAFYEAKQGELTKLGKQLNDAVTEAFADGLLDFDEQAKIQELRQKMMNIEAELAASDFDIALGMAKLDNLGELTPESYQNLMDSVTDAYGQVKEAVNKANVTTDLVTGEAFDFAMEQLETQYAEELVAEEEYWTKRRTLIEQHQNELAASQMKRMGDLSDSLGNVLKAGTEPLLSNYSEEMSRYTEAVSTAFDKLRDSYSDSEWERLKKNPQDMAFAMADLKESLQFWNDIDFAGISEQLAPFMEQLAPSVEDAQALAAQYESVGKAVPEGLAKGLKEYELLSALTGDDEALWGQMLQYLGEDNEERIAVEEAAAETGEAVATNVAEAMVAEENIAKIEESTSALKGEVVGKLSETFADGIDVTVPVNVGFDINMSEISVPEPSVAHNAKGGFVGSQTLSWLAEDGPEAVIPLNGSERAQSLWEETGALLGMRGRFDDMDFTGAVSSTQNVTYSPVINIQGNASGDDVRGAVADGYREFKNFMERYDRRQERTRWGGGAK